MQGSFQDIWMGFARFVPNLVIAIVIFLIGWFVGNLLGKVVAQIVRSIKVDHALRTAQVDQFLKRAGFNLDSGAFLGGLVEWFIVIAFLVASFEVLGLNQVNTFLQQVVLFYLPQVIVAALIILVAAVIAETMQKVVAGAAAAGGIKSANFAGSVARWAIWIFGILTALFQLGVAAPFIQTLFTGVVVAIAIALGLSFGLGGQDAAARFLEKIRQEISDRHNHS
ncbi:MAG: Small-conductance mechanosensitive ion channel-like protein [Parcubacteria group bacterium GW2011_GWA2_44_15]|nr:MAG: Small-conductance mechanosensitive ion channel-like protein [Parcubacteria group bacterium GW2011_GWA2_44_15]